MTSEQALGRLCRRAEQLQGFLEGRRKDPEASARLAEQLMQAAAQLGTKDIEDIEKIMYIVI